MPKAFRVSGPAIPPPVPPPLGLLADLPGTWIGSGFNLIARPDRQNKQPFFLELNATHETLEFTNIGGEIPNRGSEQNDIDLFGLRYLQRISDTVLHSAIHLEPGLWLHVPATTDPAVPRETYVRQATIPHGDSLLAQSTSFRTVNGGPTINPVDSTPFTGAVPGLNAPPANPITNESYLNAFLTALLPKGLPPGLNDKDTIKNPALVLLKQIQEQTINRTVAIEISTTPDGGIVNIPFVVRNANAAQMDAIFWIETVRHPHRQGEYFQLQYAQRVILDFPAVPGDPIIRWPHISVATLVKTL
jgi:hypothetical protein